MSALLLGFLVAAQLGPISLLAIRSTLRDGVWIGLAIGAAVAIVDTLYAAAGGGAVLLLAGVGVGSLSWMTILAAGVALARRRIGPRLLRAVDGVAGAGVLAFGGLLGFRTLRD